jgi:hypothetical protein
VLLLGVTAPEGRFPPAVPVGVFALVVEVAIGEGLGILPSVLVRGRSVLVGGRSILVGGRSVLVGGRSVRVGGRL